MGDFKLRVSAPHSTQNRSFRRRSSLTISSHSTEETKPNTTKHTYTNKTITQNNPKKLIKPNTDKL